MKCRGCEYPLWNLRSRTCPECGKPFAPSEFRFVPDSVRFCCPSCGQDYYGTSADGHLVPDSFVCVKCAQPVRMDDMVLLPTAGLTEERTEVERVPWLDPARRTFFGKWFPTIWMALAGPHRLARALPSGGRLRAAFWFAVLTCSLYTLVGGGIVMIPALIPLARGGRLPIAVIVGLLVVPTGAAALILAWSLASHLILRMTGKTAHGLSWTLVCMCYASAASALIAIPCLGFYFTVIGWVWPAVSVAVMLRITQRVSKTRAAFAAVTPPLVVVIALTVGIVMYVVPQVRSAMAAAGPAISAARANPATTSVLAGLHKYADANGGGTPPHALALIVDGHVNVADLYLGGTTGDLVGGVEVTRAASLPAPRRAAAVQAAAAALPAGVVAHRLGDMVFTYHGIDMSPGSNANLGLWLVVCAPAAGTSAPPLPGVPSFNIVATLGGAVTPIPTAQWPAALAKQNALRAAAGLAPLTDPAQVQEIVVPAAAPDAASPDGG